MAKPLSPPDSFAAVLFDIGGVLLRLDYRRAFRELGLGSDAETQAAMTALGNDPVYDAFERGRATEADWIRHLSGRLGHPFEVDRFREVWNGIVGEPFEGIVPLIRELRRRVPVFALTNANSTHFDSIRKRFSWFAELDGVISSHEIGCRKPEARAFEIAAERMRVPKEAILYFDDREENVRGARAVGMQASLVQRSPDDILRELRRFAPG